jgi:alkanesulfonate monooxygenase SsuD/methylene tetrahydromethanopterin reductase-like flavin-dependent oxidoreductase (luciferase family)
LRPGTDDEVRLGIVLPSREAEMRGGSELGDLLALAADAEVAGLDSLWVGDSPVARPRAEPFSLLGAVAGRTETIGLGTAALLPALRHPLHSAHAIATLDQLAPGRVTLAVGAGFPYDATEAEHTAFGVPFSGRNRRLDRHVQLWRALWSGDASAASAAAKALDLTIADEALAALPSPTTPGGPEIWLAAGPSALNADRVARLYGGWLPYVPTADGYRQGREALAAAAESTSRSPDRPPRFGLYVTLTLGSDWAAAAAEQDVYLEAYYGVGAAAVSTLQACHAGDPASAAEFLGRYIAAGARHLVVRLGSFDLGPQLRWLVDEVLPEVRAR